MVADMEVDKVADKVANMVADMEVDKVRDGKSGRRCRQVCAIFLSWCKVLGPERGKLCVKSALLPPKLQRRGLVFKGKMVTVERV